MSLYTHINTWSAWKRINRPPTGTFVLLFNALIFFCRICYILWNYNFCLISCMLGNSHELSMNWNEMNVLIMGIMLWTGNFKIKFPPISTKHKCNEYNQCLTDIVGNDWINHIQSYHVSFESLAGYGPALGCFELHVSQFIMMHDGLIYWTKLWYKTDIHAGWL